MLKHLFASAAIAATFFFLYACEEGEPCEEAIIGFTASMDEARSVIIANPNGGVGYRYSIDNAAFQIGQVFNGPYTIGDHIISVMDADSCISSDTRYLSPVVLANNTFGLVGHAIITATSISFGVTGDSAGYTISATGSGAQCFIKTYSPVWPAEPPLPGAYTCYYICDTCAHPLQPGEAIMFIQTSIGGGVASSGTVNIALVNNKYIYTFNQVPLANSTNRALGKLVSP